MNTLDIKIDNYLNQVYGDRSGVLREMEKEAEKREFPIVGPLVGRLLYQLAKMINARRVFEMGSGYGYSAYWWASAMKSMGNGSGEVLMTERSESNRKEGEAYLNRAGLGHLAQYAGDDALAAIDKVSGEFDIVFIDADKQQYPIALQKAAGRVRPGGLIVADNVLWSGKVVEEKGNASTEAIKEFNRNLFSMKEFTSSIVPVRDGVAVAFKSM